MKGRKRNLKMVMAPYESLSEYLKKCGLVRSFLCVPFKYLQRHINLSSGPKDWNENDKTKQKSGPPSFMLLRQHITERQPARVLRSLRLFKMQ